MSNNFNPVSLESGADESAEVQLRELDEYRAVLERGEFVTPEVWIERRPEARLALAALRGQFCLFEAKRLQPNAFGLETPPSSPDSTLPYAETPTTHKPEIPGHDLLDECGRGGMGVVFKARHLKLDRLVAVKVLRAGLMANEDEVRRFYAEAQAVAKLQHPNIVAIHDVGEHDGHHYFSMDYIDGASLADVIRTSPLPSKTAAHYMQIVADAIHFAHQNGVFHRDLKPSNILLQSDSTGANRGNRESGSRLRSLDKGLEDSESPPLSLFPPVQNLVPKITDFGLAKRLEGGPDLTSAGHALGTPSYMPPEQASGEHMTVGPGNDVYSLGATLYALVTGRPPFQAASAVETLRQVIEQEPAAPRQLNPAIDRDLETITLKCLQKEPTKRYASANELAADLGRYLRGEPILARPVSAPERLWRWCRRNPTVAGLTAMLGVSLLVGAGVSWMFAAKANARARDAAEYAKNADFEKGRANTKATEALKSARQASESAQFASEEKERAKKSESIARRNFYVTSVNLAQQALESGDVTQVLELLNSQIPKPGEQDLRGFEWFYLWRLCHNERQTLTGHKGEARCIRFAPDGKTLAIAGGEPDSNPGEIRLWDLTRGEAVATLLGHKSVVNSVAFSPNGRLLASGSGAVDSPGEVKLWDLVAHTETASIGAGIEPVMALAFSPDGTKLLTGSAKLTQGSGSPVDRYFHVDPGPRTSAVRLWDVGAGTQDTIFPGETGNVFAVAYAPSGKLVAAGNSTGVVKLWDVDLRRETATLEGHQRYVWSLAFSPDNETLAVGSGWWSEPGEIKLWNLKTKKERTRLRGHTGGVVSLAFSPDGRQLISGSWDRTARLWDSVAGVELAPIYGHTGYVWSAAFAPDGKTIVTADWGPMGKSDVKLWDAAKQHVFWYAPEIAPLLGVYTRFAGDQETLVSTEGERSIVVWDARTTEKRATIKDVGWPSIRCLRLSPNGRLIAAGGFYPGSKVWDAFTASEVAAYDDRGVPNLEFSPDSQVLATAGENGVMSLFSLDPERSHLALRGHSDHVWSIAFNPGGTRVASGSWDSTAKIWDATTGQLLTTLKGHKGAVWIVKFINDGKTIVTAGADQRIGLWDAQPPTGANTDGNEGSKSAAASVREVPQLDDVEAHLLAAIAHHKQGNKVEEEAEYHEVTLMCERIFSTLPRVPSFRHDLADRLNRLVMVLTSAKRVDAAKKLYAQLIAINESLATEFPTNAHYRTDLAARLHNFAMLLGESGELIEARRLVERAIDHQRVALDANEQDPQARRFLRNHYWYLADTLVQLGLHVDASKVAAELPPLYPHTWNEYHRAARIFSLCSSIAEKDLSLSADQRRELSKTYNDRSLELLREAVNLGFKDLGQLRNDPAFTSLRQLNEFETLVSQPNK